VRTRLSLSLSFTFLDIHAERAGRSVGGRIIFVLLTIFRLRKWMVDAIPLTLRYSYAVGIGLFLTFIGLNQTGIVTIGFRSARSSRTT